jgi:heat shock protein HtpX
MLRILLFLATNVAVMVVLSIAVKVLGLEEALAAQGIGIDLPALLVMAGIFGMGGSIISLLISKWSAKHLMGLHVIERPGDTREAWLLDTVARLARDAGIGMPEVAIFDSPAPNAFATGASRDQALVAVSTGLLQGMREGEIEAVLGHEVTHVANGDMVTLALTRAWSIPSSSSSRAWSAT